MIEDIACFSNRLGAFRLSSEQLTALYRHYELLKRWNKKLNLTSIRTPEEMVTRHYGESLFFANHLPDVGSGSTIADIGSGAGFPGVPIAVLRPDLRVTLVESHQRKAVFLRESTRGLANVTVAAKRAELLGERFDWLVSRAVSPDEVLALAPARAKRIGLLIGAEDFERLKSNRGFTWQNPVPGPEGERRLCVFGVSHIP